MVELYKVPVHRGRFFQEEGTSVKLNDLKKTGLDETATWADIKAWIDKMTDEERNQQALICDPGGYHIYEVCENSICEPKDCGLMNSLIFRELDQSEVDQYKQENSK